MVYLKYVYHKSNLPPPNRIGLQINDVEAVQADVIGEFEAAFAPSKVEQVATLDMMFDIYILATRQKLYAFKQIKWGFQNLHRAKLGLGFFSISDRTFVVVPCWSFYLWAIRIWLANTPFIVLNLYHKMQYRFWKSL